MSAGFRLSPAFKVVSARLPKEIVERIDERAKAAGMTRQQFLAAVIDLGLGRSAVSDPSDSRVIGPLVAVALLRKAQSGASDTGWAYRLLRDAIWEHLAALLGGKP